MADIATINSVAVANINTVNSASAVGTSRHGHGIPAGGLETGTITFGGAYAAPTGFLVCDGSAVSRTTYADLFAVIGTEFGVGDGSTTFNLPNLEANIPFGTDGTVSYAATGGSTTDTTPVSAIASHSQKNTNDGYLNIWTTTYQDEQRYDRGNGVNTGATGGSSTHPTKAVRLRIGMWIKT